MRWTDRQQAMLQAMGLRLWAPEGGADGEPLALTSDVGTDDAATVPASVPPLVSRSAAPQPAPAPLPAAGPPALSPAGAAVAMLDWPALRAAVADCRACMLCETRTQTVFGVGHPRAHWMVVGEAPGEQEDLKGEPFVGAAGRLLDRMLAALGLSRQVGDDPDAADVARQVYIANTLKCRPPRNRNPEPEELQRCQPFLERQVELVQPRVILAMGRFAVQSLLDSSEPIGRLRGRVHQWRGRPLVVTYHPAYLLRSPADKARAWADLCLAARAAETKPAG
ncbi:uracil-DNA glycosylase [Aquabacterium humicola]|uniref:uracil-DNA glycosylase n=1 Tax=Aquabacterium humicola TaxID=3237377 RepID=UPI0025430DB0|nr:uracil-DNA glycosylase [Rubrivivax pictus]